MKIEEALVLLDTLLQGQKLRDVQEQVFCYAWEGLTYPAIADRLGYDTGHIRDIGAQLWQQITQAIGEKVSKNNVQSVLRRQVIHQPHITRALPASVNPTQFAIQPSEAAIGAVQSQETQPQITKSQAINSQEINSQEISSQEISSQEISSQNPEPLRENQPQPWSKANISWGEATDASIFYGRREELTLLDQWITVDRCRLVAILGMGGIGKTTLSVKLAEQIQDQFESLIWRSLRHAPPVEELLTSLIQVLSHQQAIELPADREGKISTLMNYLRQHRCLLVLDNAETMLHDPTLNPRDDAGPNRRRNAGYSELFKRIAETRHQSCLVLTSREKPRELGLLEGETLPVRSLQLTGLSPAEAREIFRAKGSFLGSEQEWNTLIQHYAGNPLALKMVAAGIQELMDGDISECLALIQQGALVFDDIRDLLDQQFNGLSDLEEEAMYWLAIAQEPVTLSDLRENVLSSVSRQKLPETLRSLRQRSLIERTSAGFTQQPVVIEYAVERLINRICEEIIAEKINFFDRHALIKRHTKEHERETQNYSILKPVMEKLLTLRSRSTVEENLNQILAKLQLSSTTEAISEFQPEPGYAGENAVHLLRELQI